MKPKLFGSSSSSSTRRTLNALQDAGFTYDYTEVTSSGGHNMESLSAITGSLELPQLLVGGDSFVGFTEIAKYISP